VACIPCCLAVTLPLCRCLATDGTEQHKRQGDAITSTVINAHPSGRAKCLAQMTHTPMSTIVSVTHISGDGSKTLYPYLT